MSGFRTFDMNFPDLCKAGFTDKIMDADATYTYIAYGETGTAAADSRWCVKRVTTATGDTVWAGGTNDLIHPATDLPALFA